MGKETDMVTWCSLMVILILAIGTIINLMV